MEDGTIFELAILFLGIGLFFSSITRYIQSRLKIPLPYSGVVLIVGIVIGFIFKTSSKLTSTVHNVESASPYFLESIFIPPIIFKHAFTLNYHSIQKEFNRSLSLLLLLCGPAILINIALTTLFIYYVYPYNWDITESMMFSALITSSDPIVINFISSQLGLNQRLSTLIKCESLINTGVTFIVYMITLGVITDTSNDTIYEITGLSLQLSIGGVIHGILWGLIIAVWLSMLYDDPKVEIILTIFSCYISFYLAENEFHVCGVVSVIFLGLVLSKYKSTSFSPDIVIHKTLMIVWDILSYTSNIMILLFCGMVFVLSVIYNDSGFSVTLKDIIWSLISYCLIHITLFVTLLILWYPMKKKITHKSRDVIKNVNYKDFMVLLMSGSLKGIITLSLALFTKLYDKVTDDKFKNQLMIQAIIIVLISLSLNVVIMKYIVKYLNMDKVSDKQTEIILKTALYRLRTAARVKINGLKTNPNYTGADWKKVATVLPSYTHFIENKIKFPSGFCCCCKRNKFRNIHDTKRSLHKDTDIDLDHDNMLKYGKYNSSKFIFTRFGDIDQEFNIEDDYYDDLPAFDQDENRENKMDDNDNASSVINDGLRSVLLYDVGDDVLVC